MFLLLSCQVPIQLNGLVKGSNSRRANFVIMRRTNGTLNDCEM